ncbi:hypothetical protein JYU34_021612 [Plutella xylostella]|uniref:Uncharacterized protein n=1 Tax=Plutella xylostella TaxID=51655 RepID=A0ABQ7PR45_PLUXY|nr:hypothetical protein JYU34_021612 [Plutella xylostella]
MVFATGAQDLCYYNFLCAHPLASLSDFNHVFSNICYVEQTDGLIICHSPPLDGVRDYIQSSMYFYHFCLVPA